MKTGALIGLGFLLVAAQAVAGDVVVTDATARATAPGQDTAAVSLHIKAAKEAKLVGASSPAAQRVEIHIMKHANGMMEMRPVESLALPAGEEVVVGSGTHLMLIGLKHALKPGEHVHLTLHIAFADKHQERVKVMATVEAVGHEGGGMSDMKGMKDMDGMDGHDMGDHTH